MDQILAKIKQWAVGAYIAIVGLASMAAYYFYRKSVTQDKENAALRAQNELAGTLALKDEAQKDAEAKEADYKRIRDEFIKQSRTGEDAS